MTGQRRRCSRSPPRQGRGRDRTRRRRVPLLPGPVRSVLTTLPAVARERRWRPTRGAAHSGRPIMTCEHEIGLDPVPLLTPEGCEECLKTGSSWVHLRLCLSCGHVGCCDSSPGRHATKHFRPHPSPVSRPSSRANWAWCYSTRRNCLSPRRPSRTWASRSGSHRSFGLRPPGSSLRMRSKGRPMPDNDLHSTAFPKLDADPARRPRPVLLHQGPKHYQDGEALFPAQASATRGSTYSSPVRSRLLTNPATPRRRSPSTGRGSSQATCPQLTGRPALVSGYARGGCEVYEVSPDALKQLLNNHPDLGDLILQAFISRRQLLRESGAFTGLRVVGSHSSQDTFRVRDFLSRNGVLHPGSTSTPTRRCGSCSTSSASPRRTRRSWPAGQADPEEPVQPATRGGAWPSPEAGAEGVRLGRGRGRAGRTGCRRIRGV